MAAAEKLLAEDQSVEALASAAGAFEIEASLLYSGGDLEAADEQYRRAISLRDSVARQVPDDVDNGIALSASYRSQSLGKTAESIRFFQQAEDNIAGLSARFPADTQVARERYQALISSSQLEAGLGHRDLAGAKLGEAATQIQKVVAANPNDVNASQELANVEAQLGQTLLNARDATSALPRLAHSAAILTRLLDADPSNAFVTRSLGVVENQWGAAFRAVGDMKSAIEHNEKSLALAETLSRVAPHNLEFGSEVGNAQRKLSDTLLAARRCNRRSRARNTGPKNSLCGGGHVSRCLY